MYVLVFILHEVCLYAPMCIFVVGLFLLQGKVCHTGEHCDLSNLAHIYFTVSLMLNSHEVIQKGFYFLCLLNYVCVQANAFFA